MWLILRRCAAYRDDSGSAGSRQSSCTAAASCLQKASYLRRPSRAQAAQRRLTGERSPPPWGAVAARRPHRRRRIRLQHLRTQTRRFFLVQSSHRSSRASGACDGPPPGLLRGCDEGRGGCWAGCSRMCHTGGLHGQARPNRRVGRHPSCPRHLRKTHEENSMRGGDQHRLRTARGVHPTRQCGVHTSRRRCRRAAHLVALQQTLRAQNSAGGQPPH